MTTQHGLESARSERALVTTERQLRDALVGRGRLGRDEFATLMERWRASTTRRFERFLHNAGALEMDVKLLNLVLKGYLRDPPGDLCTRLRSLFELHDPASPARRVERDAGDTVRVKTKRPPHQSSRHPRGAETAAQPARAGARPRRPSPATERIASSAASSRAPRPDRFGPFELGRAISASRYMTLFDAFDRRSRRSLLLKLPKRQANAWVNDRLKHEAALLSRLRTRDALRMLETGELEGTRYICFEQVAALSLDELLHNSGRLKLDQVVDLARAAARAFAELHAQGYVHCNICPSNLLVYSARMQVKLAGFELARRREREVAVTLHTRRDDITYLAPELLMGASSLDARVDIFGLGSTLCHALTGRTLRIGEALPQGRSADARDQRLRALLSRMVRVACDERPKGWDETIRELATIEPPRR